MAEVGQRIEYRAYKMVYGLSVDDSTDCIESEHSGVITGVAKRHVRVRDDATGKVVNVFYHRIIGNR